MPRFGKSSRIIVLVPRPEFATLLLKSFYGSPLSRDKALAPCPIILGSSWDLKKALWTPLPFTSIQLISIDQQKSYTPAPLDCITTIEHTLQVPPPVTLLMASLCLESLSKSSKETAPLCSSKCVSLCRFGCWVVCGLFHWVLGDKISPWGHGFSSPLEWGTDMVSRAYTKSLEKTGTAEEEEGFRYNDGGSGDTLGHRLFFPRSQMAWDQNSGTCFLWRPTSWISMLFSSLCS